MQTKSTNTQTEICLMTQADQNLVTQVLISLDHCFSNAFPGTELIYIERFLRILPISNT